VPPNEWLQPPRSLLLILVLLTVVSASALGWFGWKLTDQERIVEQQRSRERLEQAAERVAGSLRRTLAEAGDQLSYDATANWPDDWTRLAISAAGVSGRLLYYPVTPSEPEVSETTFTKGEVLEFQQQDYRRAAEFYRSLADSPSAPIKAGALLRLARVLRKSGDGESSRRAYRQLAAVPAIVAGAPADLVARQELGELTHNDLSRSRWQLTRGQFAFYWAEAGPSSPPSDLVSLSEVAAQIWLNRQSDSGSRGQRTVWVQGRSWFVLWRGDSERRKVLIASPASILQRASVGDLAGFAAVDAEGRVLAGHRDGGEYVVRTTGEGDLPWTLYFTVPPRAKTNGLLPEQRFVLLGTSIMVLFLVAGTYFIAKAIRREMEVARMQSNFVSGVSHEFRSPLTSLRQLSELLAMGRVPNEERRHVYYDMLVRETVRLQRLVEGLLNFGRMEAGVRQYRFQTVDAANLAHQIAAEFPGREIELIGTPEACLIEADPEAMSVALRNLVDNAFKYSPVEPKVWLEWRPDRRFVAISVRDHGMGIPASEQKAIFRKFVRGSAAVAGNVKGSGVGLAMVRHIVSAHGGRIRVESEPGHGSTFTLFLPATEAA